MVEAQGRGLDVHRRRRHDRPPQPLRAPTQCAASRGHCDVNALGARRDRPLLRVSQRPHARSDDARQSLDGTADQPIITLRYWWEHLVDPWKMPMFSGCKTLLLAPALSEIALKPFPAPDSEVKVLHIYPLTDMETHMVADHGREEFVEFVEEKKIDLFSDRSD